MPDKASEEITNSPKLQEFFLPSDKVELAEQSEDGLIWKTILRTGEWKVRPGKDGKAVKRPLKIVRDHSTSDGAVGLQDIVDSFNDTAFENVTIPLSHSDKPHENTGFIRKLQVVDGEDGVSRLKAAHEFTEPEIKQKVENGSIAGNSVGLFMDYTRKSDGKQFPVALAHSALTNRPWINGMEPFQASEDVDVDEIVSAQFTEDEADKEENIELANTEVVWDDKKSLNYLRDELDTALRTPSNPYNGSVQSENYCVVDITNNKALVKDYAMNDTYIVPFKANTKGVEVAPQDQWVFAKQTYIKASEDEETQPLEGRETVLDETSALTPAASLSVQKPASPPLRSTPEDELRESQRKRDLMLSEHGRQKLTTIGGINMSDSKTVDISTLELSDDVRELIESQQAELAKKDEKLSELNAETRKHNVDKRITELKEMGLDQMPGLLKFVQEVYLSDNGGSALLLSEERASGGSTKATLTATEIVDRFIDTLPKEEGKIKLSDQLVETEEDIKPDENTDKEVPLEDRSKDARDFLGMKE